MACNKSNYLTRSRELKPHGLASVLRGSGNYLTRSRELKQIRPRVSLAQGFNYLTRSRELKLHILGDNYINLLPITLPALGN